MGPELLSFVTEVFLAPSAAMAFKPTSDMLGQGIARLVYACANSWAGDNPTTRAGPIILFQGARNGPAKPTVHMHQLRPSLATVSPYGRPLPECPNCGTSLNVEGKCRPPSRLFHMACARCGCRTQELGPPVSGIRIPLKYYPDPYLFPWPQVLDPKWVWKTTEGEILASLRPVRWNTLIPKC